MDITKIFFMSNKDWNDVAKDAQPLATVNIKTAHDFLRFLELFGNSLIWHGIIEDVITNKYRHGSGFKIKGVKAFPNVNHDPQASCYIASFKGYYMRWRLGADVAEIIARPGNERHFIPIVGTAE